MTAKPLNTQFPLTAPAAAPDESAQFWAGFYDLLHEAAERCRAIMAENAKAAAPMDCNPNDAAGEGVL